MLNWCMLIVSWLKKVKVMTIIIDSLAKCINFLKGQCYFTDIGATPVVFDASHYLCEPSVLQTYVATIKCLRHFLNFTFFLQNF